MNALSKWQVRFAFGILAGALIVYADNFAFQGEVSPIIIVIMMLIAPAIAGAIWGRRAWTAILSAWACVPVAHIVKPVLGMPDTLHPNTYTSILFPALFTLAISAIGSLAGMLVHQALPASAKQSS